MAVEATGDLAELWGTALGALRLQRGGTALARDLGAGRTDDDWLADAVARGDLWHVPGAAIALIDATTILGVYVVPDRRRRGVGAALVTAVRQARPGLRDALVLPGDRATKSLYESRGWRARLLTMAEPS